MSYLPKDIIDYIINENLEADFLTSLQMNVGGYSIGEIADKRFKQAEGKLKFISKAYSVNVEIEDEEIIMASMNKLYISAFISRNQNQYQLHFLVHQYPEAMKSQFEDEIAKEVIRYMIMKTIKALRLDTPEKVKKYISRDGSFGTY